MKVLGRSALVWAPLAGLLLAACSSGAAVAQPAPDDGGGAGGEARTVEVSASGSVQAEPDTALLLLGVETTGPRPQPAIDDNRRRMEAVLAALGDQGVADTDIQTVQFSVNVDRSQPPNPDGPAGESYRVTHLVRVKSDKTGTIGELLQAALDAGANRVQSVQFTLSDPTALESQARSQALSAARDKASELTGGLDAQLGAVRQIVESGAGQPRPVLAAAQVEGAAAGVPISTGSLTITVNVDVTFDLNPAQ
jgi:uncharacterized protein YggE